MEWAWGFAGVRREERDGPDRPRAFAFAGVALWEARLPVGSWAPASKGSICTAETSAEKNGIAMRRTRVPNRIVGGQRGTLLKAETK